VEIDVEYNRICGYNNGDGVPIEIHKEGVYVLEMIFGHISSPTITTMMQRRRLQEVRMVMEQS
jgi:hypothetical protein